MVLFVLFLDLFKSIEIASCFTIVQLKYLNEHNVLISELVYG
jgi:hypothetical protein